MFGSPIIKYEKQNTVMISRNGDHNLFYNGAGESMKAERQPVLEAGGFCYRLGPIGTQLSARLVQYSVFSMTELYTVGCVREMARWAAGRGERRGSGGRHHTGQ